MTSKSVWAVAFAMLALESSGAVACKVVGHTSSGEPLCMTTSDGEGQDYKDGRQKSSKAAQAMHIANRKKHLAILKKHNIH